MMANTIDQWPTPNTGGYVPSELDRLKAENERLRAELDDVKGGVMDALAEVERLRADRDFWLEKTNQLAERVRALEGGESSGL